MNKRRLLFFGFKLKSAFSLIPTIIITFLLAGALLSFVAFAGIMAADSDSSGSFTTVNAAVAMDTEDSTLNLALSLVTQMDSFKDICSIRATSYDEAMNLLKSGEVSLVVVIPDNFIDGIEYGENPPADVIYSVKSGIETLLFAGLIEAGSHSIAYVEAGIYAVDRLYLSHGLSDEIINAENELTDIYMGYTLNRTSFFHYKTASSTGNVDTLCYYIASAILGLMCILTISCVGIFSKNSASLIELYKFSGISDIYVKFCEFISVFLVFVLLFTIPYTIAGIFCAYPSLNITGFFMLLLLIFSVISFMFFICRLVNSNQVSMLLIFFLTVLMLYACGRIVPLAYIPNVFSSVGRWLPAYGWGELAERALTGEAQGGFIVHALIWDAVFLLTGQIIGTLKGRSRQ